MSTKEKAILIAGAFASMVAMGCNAQEQQQQPQAQTQQQWRQATPMEKRLVQVRANDITRESTRPAGPDGISMIHLREAHRRVATSSNPDKNWSREMNREYLKMNVLDVNMEALREHLEGEFPNKRIELSSQNVQHGTNDNDAFGVILRKTVNVTDVLVKED